MAKYAMMRYRSTVTNGTSVEVNGLTLEIEFSAVNEFYTAETFLGEDEDSLDPEVFQALQDALCKAFKLSREECVFFNDPYIYYVSGIKREYVPPEILKNPGGWWRSHTANEWKKVTH